eukprot:COSAG06_NODE_1789_length_8395_cov_13.447806_2_plen_120_part_00
MRDLADRYAFVQPDDRCCLSGGPILAKKFAVFPCMVDQQQCMFYEDELAKEVERISNPAQKRRLKELKAQMNAVRISVQYSTVQYSTVQYSTVQYSTVQYSTVQYSTVQCMRPFPISVA